MGNFLYAVVLINVAIVVHLLTVAREREARISPLKMKVYGEYVELMQEMVNQKKPDIQQLQMLQAKMMTHASEEVIYSFNEFRDMIFNKNPNTAEIISTNCNLLKLMREDLGFRDKKGKKDEFFPFLVTLKPGEVEKLKAVLKN